MPKPKMTDEMYENCNLANNLVGPMSGMEAYLSLYGELDLLNKLGKSMEENSLQGKQLPEPAESANGNILYFRVFSDEEVEGHKKIAAEMKGFFDKVVADPKPQLEPFVDFFKIESLILDQSWNYQKFMGETPYGHLMNIMTGCPNMTEYSAEEMKTALGEVYEPLKDMYGALYEFMCHEKELQTNPDMDEQKKKEFTEKRIANYERLAADFDKLHNADDATRKRLSSNYLQNPLDHLIGKQRNEDRSPAADIQALKIESAALKKGFSFDEARGFAIIGFAKGRIIKGNFDINENIKEIEERTKKAKEEGIAKLPPEEVKQYEDITKKISTTYEERQWIHAHKKAYEYTVSDRKIKEYKEKLNKNNHHFDKLTELQDYVLNKDPKNPVEKQKAFRTIEKYFAAYKGYEYSPNKANSVDSVLGHHQYCLDKAKDGIGAELAALEEEKKRKYAADFELSADLRNEAFLRAVADKFKYNVDNKSDLINDALKQFEKEGRKVEIPHKFEDFNSEAFQQTVERVADRASRYPAGLAELDRMNRLIKISKSDNTATALDIVRQGKKIGFFGKEDYGEIEKKLKEFKLEKELRDKRLSDAFSIDKRFTTTSRDGEKTIRNVLDEKVLEQEKEILDMMDKYIERKNKEIEAAGDKARKNSIKRRNEMEKARKLFAEQYEVDKKLCENKERYKEAQTEVEIYQGRKEAEKIALQNSKLGKKAMAEVEALKSNTLFRSFDEKIKKEEKKVGEILNNVTMNDIDDYNDKDRIYRNAIRKSVFDSACRSLYISGVKEAIAGKMADNKDKDFTNEIKSALKETNIEKGAKMISESMEVIKHFKGNFAKKITDLGRSGEQKQSFKESEAVKTENTKEANTLSCREIRNALDDMLRTSLKEALTSKNADKAKPAIEALDKIALVSGSDVNSKSVMEDIKIERRNQIKIETKASKHMGP